MGICILDCEHKTQWRCPNLRTLAQDFPPLPSVSGKKKVFLKCKCYCAFCPALICYANFSDYYLSQQLQSHKWEIGFMSTTFLLGGGDCLHGWEWISAQKDNGLLCCQTEAWPHMTPDSLIQTFAVCLPGWVMSITEHVYTKKRPMGAPGMGSWRRSDQTLEESGREKIWERGEGKGRHQEMSTVCPWGLSSLKPFLLQRLRTDRLVQFWHIQPQCVGFYCTLNILTSPLSKHMGTFGSCWENDLEARNGTLLLTHHSSCKQNGAIPTTHVYRVPYILPKHHSSVGYLL